MSPRAASEYGPEESSLEPIAICGMSCRLPGGIDSDSSFWEMLVEKRTGQTPRVPESRFNIDSHFHKTLERPGSFNVAGGYFLDGSPEDFDPTFFNMTPVEAQWLDPQQRRILEVAYECLVSAGATLESVAGSNTAVFVGSFTADYQQMSIRDPDFRHNYAATGVDPGIISNRIGNLFNLRGPSFTINTACSSSIYALHNACHALRSRDCSAAIVAGVNLILTVDQHMNTAKLGILSPTSTCHTFDAAADGYGRAEGAGALYIKRLSDAIRDGDPIRAVIRSTAVNTNGKVDGMGITHPSAEGQERVVRLAYQKANLDPELTVYAELHGTGTPVGDPIEVRAISRALNDKRSSDKPLLIGAVKPNIGHSEAASGIFAVMKAALMTEAAMIPGVALFQTLNPNILEKEWNVKVQTNTTPWPEDSLVRRASVSSFGYGGTNGHVIVESVDFLYPWYQHAKAKKEAPYNRSSKKPFLLCFSAHDKPTLSRNVRAIAEVASKYYLTDLAHTLNLHRSMFSHRAFTIAREGQEPEAFASPTLRTGVASKKKSTTGVGFLFTGQGAQWVGMGRVAIQEFPIFTEAIEKLDLILSRITPKPSFRIIDLLLLSQDDESIATQINNPSVAQPLCTAIQIGLVDLFSQWDIVPQVSIGHSSGEIAAAYAAGLISAPEAIVAAYCRGRAIAEHSTAGTMLAVGLGKDDVQEYLPPNLEDVCIACENSPSSVTLSGTTVAVAAMYETLQARGIFAREVKTGRAYHSPHMAAVGDAYDVMLGQALALLSENDLFWKQPRSEMISSVTGEFVEGDALCAGYWSANLRQRVLFNTAVQRLTSDSSKSSNSRLFGNVNFMIEIGPHSALSGPFKQICLASKMDSTFTYIPSLMRNKDDAEQLLSVAGSLFLTGYPVDLEEVNSAEALNNTIRKPHTQYLLVDLPPYQWNHEKKYWAEPRASAEQRTRVYPRHDLLGSRVSGLTTHVQVWQNILRHRDVPWLKDHNLGGTAIFPAAGHLSMAIEALRQVHETESLPIDEVTLRDVHIKKALVVPDTDEGIETIFRLQKPPDGSKWYAFAVESLVDGGWVLHCEGKISTQNHSHHPTPVIESALSQRVSGKRWYQSFNRVGFHYGKKFQQLQHARTDRRVRHAVGAVTVLTDCGLMQGESRYFIHPSTIDACLQLIIISIHAGRHKEMPWGVVPSYIQEISLAPVPDEDAAFTGQAVAWTSSALDERKFDTHVQLTGPGGRHLLDLKGLTCIAYDAALPAGFIASGRSGSSKPLSVVRWEPDVADLNEETFEYALSSECPTDSEEQRLRKLVSLVHHRRPLESILLLGSPALTTVKGVIDAIPSSVAVTIGFDSEGALDMGDEVASRVTMKNLPSSSEQWGDATDGPHDLVLVENARHCDSIMSLVRDGGWLVGASSSRKLLPANAMFLGDRFVISKTTTAVGTQDPQRDEKEDDCITILTVSSDERTPSLKCSLASARASAKIREKNILDFSATADGQVVIDDRNAGLFAAMSTQADVFNAVKAVLGAGVRVLWLTQGVREGKSPVASAAAGMAEGFLRTIRSEQAAARIALVDVDFDEPLQRVGHVVAQKLGTVQTKSSGDDTEFWLHRGILHIPRVYPDQKGDQNEYQTGYLPEKVSLVARTTDQELVFEEAHELCPLSEGEVSIQVLASGLRESKLGAPILVYGSVIEVCSSIDSSLVGQRVVALAYLHHYDMQTVVQTATYAVVQGISYSPEDLITTLLPLLRIANLCPPVRNPNNASQTIVSLPGPKFVTRMLAALADATGWYLHVVTATNRERDECISELGLEPEQLIVIANQTDGAVVAAIHEKFTRSPGPVVVVAHDFSPLSQEVWRSIPPSSRFLLSDAPVDIVPDLVPFGRGAAFMTVSMGALCASPAAGVRLLEDALQVVDMYPSLIGANKASIDIVDIAGTSQVLSHLEQHRSNPTVIVFRYGSSSQIKVRTQSPAVRLSPDASYLLVGCLGGLGRSLTRWMIERGARHFAFISRSGADKPEAASLIESIQQSGASTQVFRVDASDEDAVKKVVVALNATRPIRGVVHAAMVLRDGIFEQMDFQSFTECVNPKAKGALSLHNALRDIEADLDFFILTSSISALLGNTGQSNYSAANSVLDALALHGKAQGLSATSLVLPMVLDVGVVAENEVLETSLARKGLYGIDEHEMLRGFEVAMTPGEPLVVLGMEAQELARSMHSGENDVDAYWYADARFSHVRAAIESSAGVKSVSSDTDSFALAVREALAEGGTEAVIGVIASHIARKMSSILMIPADDFELDGPSLGSYGLDSMIGAEMRTWLFKEFGLDYPFQKLLAPTLTFNMLGEIVADTIVQNR